MKVPENTTVYIGGKKYKDGDDVPVLYKASEKFKTKAAKSEANRKKKAEDLAKAKKEAEAKSPVVKQGNK